MIEVHVRGLEELKTVSDRLGRELKGVLRRAVRRGARVFLTAAQTNLSRHVDTGLTRRSVIVQTRRDPNKGTVRVSVGVTNGKWNYRKISVRTQRPIKSQIPPSVRAQLLEYGFERENGQQVPASPWLRPAFDSNGNTALAEFVKEYTIGLHKAASKPPKVKR